MQAIHTKFLAPTNFKGSRVKATAQAGSLTFSWDHRFNPGDNHRAAALAYASKYGWDGQWIGAELPDGSLVWVCNTEHSDIRFTLAA